VGASWQYGAGNNSANIRASHIKKYIYGVVVLRGSAVERICMYPIALLGWGRVLYYLNEIQIDPTNTKNVDLWFSDDNVN